MPTGCGSTSHPISKISRSQDPKEEEIFESRKGEGNVKTDHLKLVIVEDEEAHFRLMERAIGKDLPDALIYHFDDAESFIQRLHEIHPDVILVDYLMPGMNGIDFLEFLHRESIAVPVIMITGQGDESIAVQAMKAGAWDYLVKTPDFFKLLSSTIEKTVRERKLRASLLAVERRFQDLVENTSDWIWELDTQGRYLYSNPVVERILGYRPDEIIGRTWYDLFPEMEGESQGAALYQSVSDGKPVSCLVSRLLDRDGREVFVETNGVSISNGAVLCISRDITDRVRAEEEKKKIDNELNTIFNSVPAIMMYKDLKNNFIRINKAAADLCGMRVEEIEGKNVAELYPLDAEKYYRDDLEVINSGKPKFGIIEEVKNPNGESRWVQTDKLPICDGNGKVSGVLVLAIDITGLKRAEEALQERDRLNRLLLDSLPQPAMLVKKDKTIVAANRTAKNAGAKVGGLCWRDFRQCEYIPQEDKLYINENPGKLPPGGTKCTFCLADEALKERRPTHDPEVNVFGRLCDTWWIPIDEEIFFHYAIDVTDIKRNERALRKEKEFVESLIHTAREGIWMIDADAKITFVNRQIAEMLGYAAQEMLGCSVFDFTDQAVCGEARMHFERSREGISEQFDFRCRRKDGSQVWGIIGTTPRFDERGQFTGVLGMHTDITQRKLTEEALRESEQRLRCVSSKILTAQEEEKKRIAGELHDGLSGSLSAIKISLESARDRLEQGEADPALLEIPIAWTQHVLDEARRLMTELRPSLLDDLGLIATLEWFFGQYRTTYPEIHVEEEFRIEEEDIPESLKIVIFRITQEAFHNIAKYSKAEYAGFSLVKQDGALEFGIEDNGDGFDLQAVLSKTNERRGLGLASMKERSELSGGSFTIQSTLGTGTILRAVWPLSMPQSSSIKRCGT